MQVKDESRVSDHAASYLTDAELIARVMGIPQESSATLLAETGGLRPLCLAAADGRLAVAAGRQQKIAAALELARRHYYAEMTTGPVLSSPAASRAYLTAQLRDLQHEVFACLFLDNRHRLISYEELFRGTIDGASVHPREVVRKALQRGAAAVVLAHNHPSGVAEPSQADELITLRLKDALGLVDVRVLDHLIVGGNRVVSLAERGAL